MHYLVGTRVVVLPLNRPLFREAPAEMVIVAVVAEMVIDGGRDGLGARAINCAPAVLRYDTLHAMLVSSCRGRCVSGRFLLPASWY